VSVGKWLAANWTYLLGATALGGVVYVAIATRPPIGGSALPPSSPPAPDPPGGPLRWIELQAPYRLFAGDVYRACVDVPFGAGWLATQARIVSGAQDMGFKNVRVDGKDAMPAGWPGPDDCDRFVEAEWGGEDRIVAGSSRIKKAWRRSRA